MTVPVHAHRCLIYLIDPGHINHSFFWKNLAPPKSEGKGNGGVLRDGPLKEAIVKTWGSVDKFIAEFNATTAAIQGSGWGWVVSAFSFPSRPIAVYRTPFLLHPRATTPP